MTAASLLVPALALAQSAAPDISAAPPPEQPVARLPDVNVIGVSPLLGSGVDRDTVPAATDVLRSNDLTRGGTTTPGALRALNEQVGPVNLDSASGNPYQPTLMYHGFEASGLQGTPEGLAVYVNGVRFNQPFGDTVNFDLIPDLAIDQMNLEGSNPVFGLNALGGALNVQLKNGFSYHGGEITASGGSFQTIGLGMQYGREKTKRKGRFLHGREGRGRFKAFVLGRVADWNVTFLDGDTLKQFAVSVIADDMERGKISEARASTARGTGTELVISEPPHDLRRLRDDDARQALTEILAPYLLSYADVRVSVEGVLLDPPSGIADRTPHPLTPVVVDGATHSVTLDLIEWKRTSERLLFLCGEHGFPLLTLEGRLPASERGFSAYLRSPLIQILHDRNELGVGGLNPTLEAMITEARAAIRDHLRRRAAAEAQNVIQRWKDEAVYPYTEAPTSPLEEVQRQYFDIVATTAARHIDDFDQASQRARRLQLRTLRIAVEQGGEDVQFALQEVLNLPKKELADFVGLLKETSLSAIIGGVKVVSDRLKVLTGLEALISDEDTSASLKERTQLHRLVAENTWLFGEEFHLMADDEGLNRCLVEHARMRDVEVLDMKPVAHPSKKRGIVDLMFGKRRQVYRATDLEHLVVELKAPKVSIKEEQIRQVEGYARAIASDDRFDKVNTRWVFWALSKEIDEEYAQYRRGDLGPSGPVHRRGNLSIWVKTWGALFNENRARLQFYQDALALKITREGALESVQKVID